MENINCFILFNNVAIYRYVRCYYTFKRVKYNNHVIKLWIPRLLIKVTKVSMTNKSLGGTMWPNRFLQIQRITHFNDKYLVVVATDINIKVVLPNSRNSWMKWNSLFIGKNIYLYKSEFDICNPKDHYW